MKSKKFTYALIAFTSLLLSCGGDCDKNTKMEQIQIPFGQVKTLNLDDGEIIRLETSDESLLSYITNLEILDDDIILSSGNSVIRFDAKGNYLNNIGGLGHSNHEYLDTRNMIVSDSRICIFDWSSHKMNFYDSAGKYLSKIDIQPNDQNIYPSTLYTLNDGTLLSNNCYQGNVPTPAFSVLSPSGELLYHIKGLEKIDGTTHNELRYSSLTNTLLYTEAFNDTIYQVKPDKMKVVKAYYVDFGEHKFTKEEKMGRSFAEMCAYSNKEENIMNKAAIIHCCYEDHDKMMFVFYFRKKVNFVIYEKDIHHAHVFKLEDKTGKLIPKLFAAYTESDVYFCCDDANNMKINPIIVKIPYKKLLKNEPV